MRVRATSAAGCYAGPRDDSERFGRVRGHRAVIGEVIDRRYRIDAELGSGGMGVVYRATHTLIGKQVAIKVLRSQHARDEEAVKRFLQEARLASAIEHVHVVDLSDFGQLEDGRLFYVMELLEGRSLAAEIDLRGPLSPHRALRVALQVARGLGAAHAKGIVHRDLKPDNIFLCRDGSGEDHVKLFDFGIARAGDSRLTRPGAVLGTPEYMPPEQTMGMAVDGRADLYALGVILFEMLTGKVPLSAADVMELFQMHLSTQPPKLVEVAAGLADLQRTQALLDRLLAKRAEDRPRDAEAVQLAILDAIAADAPQETRRTTRAMGSGGHAEAHEPAPESPAGGTVASASPWIPPAPLVALSTPSPAGSAARRTPAYAASEDTTPLGSAVVAALAMPRPVEDADAARMSTAPTMARIAAPPARPAPQAAAIAPADEAPRVTQPQSLVLTGPRIPAPSPAAAGTAPVPSRGPGPSIATLTLGSAIAAGVLTLGGVGIAKLGGDAASGAPASPAEVVPAAVAAPLEVPIEPAARAAAPEPTPEPRLRAPAAGVPADPDPPAPAGDGGADPIEAPSVGTDPTHARDDRPEDATATQGKPKPRAKKPVTATTKSGSDAPSSASKRGESPKPAGHEPPGTAPATASATDDEPKRKPKRSIDLKDPFGTN